MTNIVTKGNLSTNDFKLGTEEANKITVNQAPAWVAGNKKVIVTGSDGTIYTLATGGDTTVDPVAGAAGNWLTTVHTVPSTGGLTSVATDATLTGDGTTANPLHVVPSGGGGSTEVSDGDSIVGDGTATDPFAVGIGFPRANPWSAGSYTSGQVVVLPNGTFLKANADTSQNATAAASDWDVKTADDLFCCGGGAVSSCTGPQNVQFLHEEFGPVYYGTSHAYAFEEGGKAYFAAADVADGAGEDEVEDTTVFSSDGTYVSVPSCDPCTADAGRAKPSWSQMADGIYCVNAYVGNEEVVSLDKIGETAKTNIVKVTRPSNTMRTYLESLGSYDSPNIVHTPVLIESPTSPNGFLIAFPFRHKDLSWGGGGTLWVPAMLLYEITNSTTITPAGVLPFTIVDTAITSTGTSPNECLGATSALTPTDPHVVWLYSWDPATATFTQGMAMPDAIYGYNKFAHLSPYFAKGTIGADNFIITGQDDEYLNIKYNVMKQTGGSGAYVVTDDDLQGIDPIPENSAFRFVLHMDVLWIAIGNMVYYVDSTGILQGPVGSATGVGGVAITEFGGVLHTWAYDELKKALCVT